MNHLLFLIGSITYLTAMALDLSLLGMLAKPLPIAVLILMCTRAKATPLARAVTAGLVFSMVGDTFLLFEQGFLPGLVWFLTAHLCYLYGFIRHTRGTNPLLLLPFLAWGLLAWWVLQPLPKDLAAAVPIYMTAICAMMWRAASMLKKSSHSPTARYAFTGALLFGISDTILAYNRFADPFDLAPYLVMITYYAAQYLIAKAALQDR